MAFATAILVTVGCNTSKSTATNDTSRTTPSAAPAAEAVGGGTAQPVTLVGCLKSAPAENPTAASPSSSATSNAGRSSDQVDRFTLVNAIAPDLSRTGVGAHGAGASGGPLVSGKATYELDAVPLSARTAVNKQVEISGRLDIATAVADSTTPASRGTAGTAAAGSSGPSGREPGGPLTFRRVAVEAVKVVAEGCDERD
jgi:hypothetical protein